MSSFGIIFDVLIVYSLEVIKVTMEIKIDIF